VTRIIHNGTIVNKTTQKGIAGLRVEAWDDAGVVPDMLGYAITDADGRFQMVQDLDNVERIFEGRKAVAYFKAIDPTLITSPPPDHYDVVADTQGVTTWDLSRAVTSSSTTFADAAGVGTVNDPLANFVVRGLVSHVRTGPVVDADAIVVTSVDIRLNGNETALPPTMRADDEGRYRLEYAPSDLAVSGKDLADLQVRGKIGTDLVTQSAVYFQAPPTVVVDLITDKTTSLVGPETTYDEDERARVEGAVAIVLDGAEADTIDEERVTEVARSARREEAEVRALRAASLLANATTPVTLVSSEALYGLIRQGLPEDRRSLLTVPAASHRAALIESQGRGHVRRMTDYELDDEVWGVVEEQVKLAIDEPLDAGTTSNLGDVVDLFLTGDDRKQRGFVRRFATHEGNLADLWPELESPFAPSDITNCKYWWRADTTVFKDVGATQPASDTDAVKVWKDSVSGATLTPVDVDPSYDAEVGVLAVEGVPVNSGESLEVSRSDSAKSHTICIRVTQAGSGARTLLTTATNLRFDLDDGNGMVVFDDGTSEHSYARTPPDGDRVFTLVLDDVAATSALYIDGRLVGQSGYAAGTTFNGAVTLGAKNVSSVYTQEVASTVHDVVVYDRALSDDELAKLHKYAIRNPFAELTTTEAQKTRLALQWGAVSRFHLPLLTEMRTEYDSGATELWHFGKYVESDWVNLLGGIASPSERYPADMTGADDTEKRDNYIQVLIRTMERVQPTAAILGRLIEAADSEDAKLRTFLDDANHRTFEFGLERMAHAVAAAVDDSTLLQIDADEVQARGERIQRLYFLTPRYSEMKPMLDIELESAHDIVAMSEDRFVAELQVANPTFDADAAKKIHAAAEARRNTATFMWAAFSAQTNGPLLAALPDWQTPTATPDTVALAGWEDIFGKMDLCACEHCRSVFSPAAYLVDLVQFLDKHSSTVTRDIASADDGHWSGKDLILGAVSPHDANDVIAGRRPDIAKIKLNCSNTNTALPYVDLVNELLEFHVATTPVSVDIDTTGDTPALLSAPEILDSAVHASAYTTLSTEAHPWNLPYSLWQEQARTYLEHLGVPRHALMDAFSKGFKPADVPDCAMWLRADAGVITERGRVAWWADLSGNGNDLRPIDGENAPTYAAVGGSNAQGYLEFSGSEILHAPHDATLEDTSAVTMVVITSDVPGNGWLLTKGAWGVAFNYNLAHEGGNVAAWLNGGSHSGPAWNGTGGVATVSLATVESSQASVFRRDGVESSDSTPTLTMTGNSEPLYLGARPVNAFPPTLDLHFTGRIYEVMVFTRKLTAAEIDQIEGYAAKRYGAAFTPTVVDEVSPSPIQVAQEQLDMSSNERALIVSADPIGFSHWELWGLPEGTSPDTWDKQLEEVPVFLAQSGLSYDELRELLDTALVDGFAIVEQTVSLAQASGTSGCNIADLVIANLEPTAPTTIEDAWVDIGRFLRLRRRLGWDVRHLDKVKTALGASLDDDFLQSLAAIEALREHRRLRRIEPDALGAMWGDIDIRATPSLDEASLYDRIFLNLSISNPAPTALREPTALSGRIDEVLDHVLGALGMHGSDFRLLTTGEDAQALLNLPPAVADRALTLASLSRLYRIQTLARALRRRTSDLVVVQALADLAPLAGDDASAAASPTQARMFLKDLEAIDRSGLSVPMIHYLVRHVVQPGSGVSAELDALDEQIANLDTAMTDVVAQTTYAGDMTGQRVREVLEHLAGTTSDGSGPDDPALNADVEAIMAILDGTSSETEQAQKDRIDSVLGPYFDDTTALHDLLVFDPKAHADCLVWLDPADLVADTHGRFGSWNNSASGGGKLGSDVVRLPEPTDVTGCQLWLRADLGVTTSAAGLVTAWADQTTNGNDAAQATQSAQPRALAASGVGGAAGIDFDGTDDFLEIDALTNSSDDLTIIVVHHQRDATNTQTLLSAASSTLAIHAVTAANDKNGFSPAGTEVEFASGAALVGDQITTMVLNSASGATLYRNGVSTDTATYSTSADWSANDVVLGGETSAFFDGIVSEVLIYDRVLDAEELAYVHGLLESRYGLGGSKGSVKTEAGPFGLGALDLSGSDDHLVIDGLLDAADYTVVAVVRQDPMTDGEGRALLAAKTDDLIFAAQADVAGTPTLGVFTDAWDTFDDAEIGDQILTWVVDDTGTGGTIDIYRDGAAAGAQQTYGTTISVTTENAGLGGLAGNASKTFDGAIACLGVFKNALAADELSSLHQHLFKITQHEKRYDVVLKGLLDAQRERDATSLIGESLAAPFGLTGSTALALANEHLSSLSDPTRPLAADLMPATNAQPTPPTETHKRHAMLRFQKAAYLVRELEMSDDDVAGAFGPYRDNAWLDVNVLPLEMTPYVRFDARQAPVADGVFELPGWLRIACPTAERSVQTSPTTVQTGLGADAARAISRDSSTWGLLVEPGATNLVDEQDLSNWTDVNTPTLTAATTPNGQAANVELADDDGASDERKNLTAAGTFAANTAYSLGVWMQKTDNPGNISAFQVLRAGAFYPGFGINLTTIDADWTHRVDTATNDGTGGTAAFRAVPISPGAEEGTCRFWGAMVEQRSYLTSFIGADNATFTRAQDTLFADVASMGVATDGYFDVELAYAPLYAQDEAGDDHDLLFVDSNNRVYFDESAATIVARIGGVDVTSAALTFSRHQEVTVTVSHQASGVVLTIAGATTGNGTTTGTAQAALSPAPSQVYVLGNASGAQEGAELRALQWGTSDLPQARIRYRALMNLVDALEMRDTFRAKDGTIWNLLASYKGDGAIGFEDALAQLAAHARWSPTDVAAAATALGLDKTAELGVGANLRRLHDGVRTIEQLGASRATQWIDVDESVGDGFATADEVIGAAKAKYGDERWQEIGRGLRDKVRETQRDALVGYLVSNPPHIDVTSTDSLYEYTLVDVEMSPCALTSRIKQATGSIQTFINRALMGLEPELPLGDVAAREYEWMRNYRVWEANRKVFFYPENWLEPRWRDDKTPLFEQFESRLNQGELTNERAEAAYIEYIESLDELSGLEVVGLAHHLEPATADERAVDELHVIGRVPGNNVSYYHRCWVDHARWMPWRKIEVEIGTDLVLPVVENGRLVLVAADLVEAPHTIVATEGGDVATNQYQVTMWAIELRDDTWGPRIEASGTAYYYPPKQVATEPLPPKSSFTLARKGSHIFVVHDNALLELEANNNGWNWGGTSTTWGLTTLAYPRAIAKAWFGQSRGFIHLQFATEVDHKQAIAKPYKCRIEFTGFRNALPIGDEFKGEGDPLSVYRPTKFGATQQEVLLKTNTGFRLQDARISGGDVVLPNETFVYEDGAHRFFVSAPRPRPSLFSDAVGALPAPAQPQESALADYQTAEQSEVTTAELSDAWDSSSTTVVVPQQKHDDRLQFQSFDHPYTSEMVRRIRRGGVDAVRGWDDAAPLQMTSNVFFALDYIPNEAVVQGPVPIDNFDFTYGGAYSAYNWELFFHIPFMIAARLASDGLHDEARRWLHAIFDPTRGADNTGAERLWKVKPFAQAENLSKTQDNLATSISIEDVVGPMKAIASAWGIIAADETSSGQNDIALQAEEWRASPFRPFVLARRRPLAFQKATVMRYIDNLVEWGDKLFRRDSIESTNEATHYYLLAKGLLGPRPQMVDDPGAPTAKTLDDVSVFNSVNNPAVFAENLTLAVKPTSEWGGRRGRATVPVLRDYFCVPPNENLLALWDTIDDRLFKLRHCLDIDGIRRELPLFEPPIDPALLVDATAAGVDIGAVLDDLAAPMPYYRFDALVGRAFEQVGTVTAFGSALLGAWEKRDGEHLARLRQTHELAIQKQLRDTRKAQIAEAKENLESALASRLVVDERLRFYAEVERVNQSEQDALGHLFKASGDENRAMSMQMGAKTSRLVGSFISGVAGAGPASWAQLGADLIAAPLEIGAEVNATSARNHRDLAARIGTRAGYTRRWEEWKLNERLAERELKQIDKQILAARIRLDIAERELATLDKQREQAKEVEVFLRDKFTAETLYDWHVEQLSDLYYQAYKVAYEMCRSAEKAYRYERGEPTARFVNFGAWDGRRKGLLAGEKLQLDLRRMQAAYTKVNRREYELVKSVSLAEHFPEALLALREVGAATIALDEGLFDADFPGHYMRRIKSTALTLPAVTGPYTAVNCTLTLRSNKVRHDNIVGGGDYLEDTQSPNNDSRFTYHYGSISSVCTSSGQNDAGVFELNFRDERYLPFEGAGVISEWRIELPHDTNRFDVRSLTDVVLQISYMAREGGEVLRAAAREEVLSDMHTAKRLYHVSQDFGDDWFKFSDELDSGTGEQVLTLSLADKVPFLPGVGETRVSAMSVAATWEDDGPLLPTTWVLPDGTDVPASDPPLAVGTWPSTPVFPTGAETAQDLASFELRLSQADILALGSKYIETWPDNAPGGTYKRVKPSALTDLILIVDLERDAS
jgi:Tc toxin complex TcA C-terminal TcB-binding domain/ABC toxin N-terminal region/Neuraminidase-like domain/Concanavalin A-like lectin/glucanases superfamily